MAKERRKISGDSEDAKHPCLSSLADALVAAADEMDQLPRKEKVSPEDYEAIKNGISEALIRTVQVMHKVDPTW